MSRFVDTDLTFIGLSNSNGELKTKDAPPLIPPVVSQAAINWLRTRMGWAAAQVGEETAKKLAEALATGFAAGESMDDIADRVAAVFDMTGERAIKIARTETLMAANEASLMGYKESGVVQTVTWFTAEDERVCDLCGPMDGNISTVDESSGMLPAHPQCRCCWLPNVNQGTEAIDAN